ncbi:HAD domain-containing protein [Klebsiella sp. CN_Kp114]|uniref:HAD domain-containing protein n=1 Tax=unclassified Klebsiella TaxID=2608929 RepID=UPI0032B3BDC4
MMLRCLLNWLSELNGRTVPLPGLPVEPLSCEGEFWLDVNPSRHWLFLDIDGVLHRAENGSLEFMPVLEDLLASHPNVGIILSTNWRIGVSRDAILRHFPPAVRERIAGANPDLDGKVVEYVRWQECMSVVENFGLERYTFVDDTARLFPLNCPDLFLTSRHQGLNRDAAEQLCRRLS